MMRESRAQSTTKPLRRRREPPTAPAVVAVEAPPSIGQVGRHYRLEAARWLCRMTVRAFGLLYLAALAFTGISALGWFDFAPRPLAGVFVVVMGLPWTVAATWFPDHLQPLVAALAPLVTLVLLWSWCHWPRRRN